MNKEYSTEKYFDILLEKIECTEKFSVINILSKEFRDKKILQNDFNKLCESVERFGFVYEYFEKDKSDIISRLVLRKEGLNAKKAGGHLKYIKSLKKLNSKKWYNENWVGYLIAFIVLLFSVYQYFDNRSLRYELESRDFDIVLYKDSLSDMKLLVEKQMKSKSKDTLPKSLNRDLKN